MYGNYPAYNPVPDPAMAAMQERLKNMQQQYRPMPPQPAMPMYGIKGRPVTNIEEARAAQIDFDGSMSYFPCPAERKIFAKGLDLNGNPVFEGQLSVKRQQVKDAIERIGHITGCEVLPVLGMENPWHYRNKMQFPAATAVAKQRR